MVEELSHKNEYTSVRNDSREDEEPSMYGCKTVEETHSPSKRNSTVGKENKLEEREMENGLYRKGEDTSVKDGNNDGMTAIEVQSKVGFENVHLDPQHAADNQYYHSLDSIEEDIPEKLSSETADPDVGANLVPGTNDYFCKRDKQPDNGSKTADEISERNIAGDNEIEERQMSDELRVHLKNVDSSIKDENRQNGESDTVEEKQLSKNEKDSKSMAMALSVNSDDEEFEQQKELFKSRIEQQMCELEKEHSLMLEEFAQASDMARPLGKDINFGVPSTQLQVEKDIRSLQDELRQVHDESIHAFKKGGKGKTKYKKLKKKLTCNEEQINSLVQAYQRDSKEHKEKELDFQCQIQHDMGQMRILLKEVSKNKVIWREEGQQSADEDGFENQLKKMNEILEKTVLKLQRNENEHELKRVALRQENGKAQDLEDTFQELKTRLQKKEFDLESIKRKLKERDERIEELNRKMQEEKKDKMGLRKVTELAEGRTRQQVIDKDSELNKLRQLFSETSENSDRLQDQVKSVHKELEDTKGVLAQRDTELTMAKTSLCKLDQLLCDFRQSLTEREQELEETKKALVTKDEALETISRYADCEVRVLQELVTKVVRDVRTVEKVQVKLQTLLIEKDKLIQEKEFFIVQLKEDLQHHGSSLKEKESKIEDLETVICQLKKYLELNSSSLKEKDKAIKELELSIEPLKKDLETHSVSLKEKDNKIEDLESSVVQFEKNLELSSSSLQERNNKIEDLESFNDQLKGDLELINVFLNERSNELQQTKSYVQEKERELDISNGKSILLEEDNNCLRNKSMILKSQFCQQQEEVEELKKLALTRNSELRTGRREVEKMRHFLQEKEHRIHFMKRTIAAKEHDNDILTGNMKKRFFEIRSLQRTLDDVKNERRKLSELCQLKTGYFETKIKRLDMEIECNNILLGKKDRALETANLGIQAKEEYLETLKERLWKQEIRFELYKKISTEREYKLLQEKRALEKNMKVAETGSCEKDSEKMVECPLNAKGSDSETMDEQSSDESNRLEGDGKSEVVTDKEVGVTESDRLAQMEANISAMKKELERSRDNNATLSKKNKELIEKVNELHKEAVEKRSRLNNTLNNVHMKAVEIQRLESLLQKLDKPEVTEDEAKRSKEEVPMGDAIQKLVKPQVRDDDTPVSAEPKALVEDVMPELPEPQMPENATQETAEPLCLVDNVMLEPAEPKVPVDDEMQELPEANVPENTTQKTNDPPMTEDAQHEPDESQMTENVPQESAEPQVPVDDIRQESAEPQVPVDGIRQESAAPQVPVDGIRQESAAPQVPVDGIRQESAEPQVPVDGIRQESAEPQVPVDGIRQESAEPQVPVDGIRQESAEPQVPVDGIRQESAAPEVKEEVAQETETPESSHNSSFSLSLSDLGF